MVSVVLVEHTSTLLMVDFFPYCGRGRR